MDSTERKTQNKGKAEEEKQRVEAGQQAQHNPPGISPEVPLQGALQDPSVGTCLRIT